MKSFIKFGYNLYVQQNPVAVQSREFPESENYLKKSCALKCLKTILFIEIYFRIFYQHALKYSLKYVFKFKRNEICYVIKQIYLMIWQYFNCIQVLFYIKYFIKFCSIFYILQNVVSTDMVEFPERKNSLMKSSELKYSKIILFIEVNSEIFVARINLHIH